MCGTYEMLMMSETGT